MSLLYHNDTIIKKEKELLRALLGQFCKLEVVIVNHFLIFQSMDSALNLLSQHLMEQMLKKLKMQGYKQVSLSVQKMNYAVHMYLKVGFEIVDENDEEYIMICKL